MNIKKIYLSVSLLCFSIYLLAQHPDYGVWRGEIHYEQTAVPFQFELASDNEQLKVTVINGEERRAFDQVQIKGDSVIIGLGVFDAEIRAHFTKNTMAGHWVKYYKNMTIPFAASLGAPRYITGDETINTIAEKWQMTFEPEAALAYPGVGLWQQKGSKVYGTVMTEVSDFRYFEGVVEGDSIKLSSFDGAHAFAIEGKKTQTGWEGTMHFDNNYQEPWKAKPNAEAKLPDPWEMEKIKPGTQRPFYDILAAGSGKNAIDESKYFNKVLIIQLFGTWCPNSLDESEFLIDWYEKNKEKPVEILAVSYEANYSQAYGEKRIAQYKDRLNIPYEVKLGGQLSKSQAALAFPFMNKIQAFPTLVIVDKFGYVRYVHSYFNGPATGSYYEAFKTRFNAVINELINE